MSLPGVRPYLQSGQQRGKVGQLLLECLLLFLVLAAGRAGDGTVFARPQGAIQPQASQNTLGRGDSPRRGLSLWFFTSAQLSGVSFSSQRAAPANGTATLCPTATPVPSPCPGCPVGTGVDVQVAASHLHAAEEGVDGRLLLTGTVANLLDHGLEQDYGLTRGGLQFLHSLPKVAGWLQCRAQHCTPPPPPHPPALPTITAWSSRWQPCMYAVSMSMQCARLSLQAQTSGESTGWSTQQVWGWDYSPLHIPEAVDAEHGLLLSGEHDVGLLMQRCRGQEHSIAWHGAVPHSMARGSPAWHSRHFLWMSLVRLERETISWRANILARWVSSRHGAQRGCPQVLQKYMVSSSCVRGHSWWQAWPWQGFRTHPTCPPCCSHRLGAAPVTVGTLHVLLAIG